MQANKSKQKKFDSFAEYARNLEKSLLQFSIAEKVILETVGVEVEKNAKSKFGEYQEGVGRFEKWPELAESTKEDRVKKGFSENDPLLRDGTLRDSVSHSVDLARKRVEVGSTSEVMVWQELGTDRIPPRPVIGPAMYEKKARIQALCGEVMFALLTNQVRSVK